MLQQTHMTEKKKKKLQKVFQASSEFISEMLNVFLLYFSPSSQGRTHAKHERCTTRRSSELA